MAQHDVYPIPQNESHQFMPYVVDVQSSLIDCLSTRLMILDSSIERARVGRWRRVWVGRKPRLQTCLRTFGRLEQAMPLAWLRPARATTQRAPAR